MYGLRFLICIADQQDIHKYALTTAAVFHMFVNIHTHQNIKWLCSDLMHGFTESYNM